jgi:hypothetical protein
MSLNDRLIKELMDATAAKSRTEAIHLAISEFIRRKKLEGLKALSGKVRIADRWQELEEHELKAQEQQERHWRGHR